MRLGNSPSDKWEIGFKLSTVHCLDVGSKLGELEKKLGRLFGLTPEKNLPTSAPSYRGGFYYPEPKEEIYFES